MKHLLRLTFFTIIYIVFANAINAQILNPVKWDYSTKKISECEIELIFKAKLDDGWHVYGQKAYDDGPVPTSIHFAKSSNYELIGKPVESKLIKKFEPVFGTELEFFDKEAIFKQKVRIKSDKTFEIKDTLEYMTCNNVQCLAPTTLYYTFKIDGSATCVTSSLNNNPSKTETAKDCNIDSNKVFEILKSRQAASTPEIKSPADTSSKASVIAPAKSDNPGNNNPESTEDKRWWYIFLLGFIAGFSALLTPCVFPMIPMTVSFFTKQSKTRSKGIKNASIYSLSIIGIYTTLGVLFTLIFGVDALHSMSTNVWFNLFFFLMLVVFAVSFLGAFQIVLPSRFINKMDARSDKGGLAGIFFMAFTLALVSFSCTSAFIGPLLFSAGATGNIAGPFWGMFGFSTALALPFGLFAAFPGWLNSIPKSGGWLNSVKVCLGFIELALAFKFASNADLVVQANILTREVFIAIWIVISALMGIYLLGGFRMAHDSEVKHLSVTRLFFAMVTLSFTVYLIPGMWGAPLKIISGFPPPDFYAESPNGLLSNSSGNAKVTASAGNENKSTDRKLHCPNNLPCFHDYNEALAYARKAGKPLMLDFTGWACVNCRKMESQVWTDPEVDKRLRNDVVVVSLYVDDGIALPKEEQTVKKLGNSDFSINTIGNKWAFMQADRYKTNSQPQYILIDNNEQMLTKTTAHYDPDIKKYIDWLDEGINEYKKKK